MQTGESVLFAERANDFPLFLCLTNLRWGGIVKASVNSASLERAEDPKPGELATVRMSQVERLEEVRTHQPCKIGG